MLYAIIEVNSSHACVTNRRLIPAGIIGAQVQFVFDDLWTDRSRTVVFQAGDVMKDVIMLKGIDTVTVPSEVVAEPCSCLRVGVYGAGIDGTVLPTLWVNLGQVYEAVNPSGDESTDPSLPVWAQIQVEMEDLKKNSVDLTGYATENWVQVGFQPKGEYLTEHQDISGKLDASELPSAIDAALAMAKESGEFDGRDGSNGYSPYIEDGYWYVYTEDRGTYYNSGVKAQGEEGKTPVKGVDYCTDTDRQEMVNAVIAALPVYNGEVA